MMNMIYATHIPKRERKRALRDVYAMEPVAPKFNPWSSIVRRPCLLLLVATQPLVIAFGD